MLKSLFFSKEMFKNSKAVLCKSVSYGIIQLKYLKQEREIKFYFHCTVDKHAYSFCFEISNKCDKKALQNILDYTKILHSITMTY